MNVSDLSALIGETPMPPEERAARVKLIGLLFRIYRDADTQAAEATVTATLGIPLDKLAAAVAHVLQTHKFSKTPVPADLWQSAKEAAGMHREQYRAGHYLPPPRDWPPAGKRHAIEAGELEEMPRAGLLLGEGSRSPLLEDGS